MKSINTESFKISTQISHSGTFKSISETEDRDEFEKLEILHQIRLDRMAELRKKLKREYDESNSIVLKEYKVSKYFQWR